MGDSVTTATQSEWECSASFVQHYQECREHVARWLAEHGSERNTMWPDGARFISGRTVTDPSLCWHLGQIAGFRGVSRHISGKQMHMLFPNGGFDPNRASYDVSFIEVTSGNVRKEGQHSLLMQAQALKDDGIFVVNLGCDHPNATVVRSGYQYNSYRCPHCGYEWGVDTSG